MFNFDNEDFDEYDFDEFEQDVRYYTPYRDLCSEILPNLFLSDYVAASQLELLTKNGITHVISLGGFADHNLYSVHEEADYMHVFIDDSFGEPISEHFDECIEFIKHGMVEGKVLVHCHAGISRSATIVIAYLMYVNVQDGKPPNYLGTHNFVKSKRECINPNFGFVAQLMEYDAALNSALLKKM